MFFVEYNNVNSKTQKFILKNKKYDLTISKAEVLQNKPRGRESK